MVGHARCSRMETVSLLFILLLAVMAGIRNAGAADFYVSENGSDAWSGKLPEPEGDDGPFATLERARDAVRALKKRTGDKGIIVQIRGGHYRLRRTVVFGMEDSGGDSTITYEAFPGERPVFSSDVELGAWKKPAAAIPFLPKAARGKVWVTDVPKFKGAPWRFLTLYDAEGLLPRARSKGFIPAKSSRTQLRFPAGTMREWSNLEDVEIVVRPHHAWVVNILPLASVDAAKRTATTSIPATYAMNELHFLPGTESAWVENVIDALDEPGEWVLDSNEGKLYLWPRADGPPKGIVAPRLREYVRVEGRIDAEGPADTPVRNLRFRGLTFTRGETYRVAKDDKGLQHDWEMHDKANALVRLRGAEDCVIARCHFLQSGGTAIRVDLHGQKNKIQSNHIEHIGATGILLCGYGPGTKDVSHHNLISNNHVHHVGEIHAHSPGVFLWQSGENRVANNLVHHTPYSGIILSGAVTSFFSKEGDGREVVRTMRRHELGARRGKTTLEEVRPYLHTHDNLIEYNEIHHAMQQLNDGNGIYIRGAGAGNIIRRNYIHDLLAPTVMQSSIRTDGGQRDTLITENLVFRCVSQGMQIKLNNHAINNVIADIRPGTHKGEQRPPTYFKLYEGPMTGGAYQRNILYHPGSDTSFYQEINNRRTPGGAYAKDADTDHNIYYCAKNPSLSKAVLAAKQREGVDKNSLAEDPLFEDPEKGDFRFKPNSPAPKLGIVPIDLSKIGLRDASQIPSR